MRVEWAEFKSVIDETNLDILMTQNDDIYFLSAGNETFLIRCHLLKDTSTETLDFEANYLTTKTNQYRQKYDATGKPFARFAIANEGHILNCLALTFTTSKSGSLKCTKDDNATNVDGLSYAQYDANGNAGNDLNSVKTEVAIELPYDLEMVGGRIWQKASPLLDVFAYLTAVPDVPEAYGGSKPMCGGGMNLKFLDRTYGIDGRAPKTMYYDAINHTNKLRLRFFHDAGFQHDLMFSLEAYK